MTVLNLLLLQFTLIELYMANAYTQKDYCRISNQHTMCRYKGKSQSCDGYASQEINLRLQEEIVEAHNKLRNKVASGNETRGDPGPQPPASNMHLLEWDKESAATAQRWADQCIPTSQVNKQHDECRDTDRFPVGQNVITVELTSSNQTKPNFTAIIQEWYNEVMHIDSVVIQIFQGNPQLLSKIGHYSQIVWAETRYVGCGYASFQELLSSSNKMVRRHRFICNYGPGGNIIGSSVYKMGPPCSTCVQGCNSKYNALCIHDPNSDYQGLDSASQPEPYFSKYQSDDASEETKSNELLAMLFEALNSNLDDDFNRQAELSNTNRSLQSSTVETDTEKSVTTRQDLIKFVTEALTEGRDENGDVAWCM